MMSHLHRPRNTLLSYDHSLVVTTADTSLGGVAFLGLPPPFPTLRLYVASPYWPAALSRSDFDWVLHFRLPYPEAMMSAAGTLTIYKALLMFPELSTHTTHQHRPLCSPSYKHSSPQVSHPWSFYRMVTSGF